VTVSQFIVMCFTRHHSGCHPGVNRGKIVIQQTSQIRKERLEFGLSGQLSLSG